MSVSVDDPEDRKLLVLARTSRARTGAAAGAAVRDIDGRTYAAVDVELGPLRLPALRLAAAMAASSGARGLEAAALVGDRRADVGSDTGSDDLPTDVAVVRALGGPGVAIWLAGADGAAVERVET